MFPKEPPFANCPISVAVLLKVPENGGALFLSVFRVLKLPVCIVYVTVVCPQLALVIKTSIAVSNTLFKTNRFIRKSPF